MTTSEIVYYLLMKKEVDTFQKTFEERIKNKQNKINEKLARMNELANEIREELSLSDILCK